MHVRNVEGVHLFSAAQGKSFDASPAVMASKPERIVLQFRAPLKVCDSRPSKMMQHLVAPATQHFLIEYLTVFKPKTPSSFVGSI
jgi:hypothetical protein